MLMCLGYNNYDVIIKCTLAATFPRRTLLLSKSDVMKRKGTVWKCVDRFDVGGAVYRLHTLVVVI